MGVKENLRKAIESGGYDAMVDWPGSTFYKEFMELYPNAKVLLNKRDPEKWYNSFFDTIFQMAAQKSDPIVRWFAPFDVKIAGPMYAHHMGSVEACYDKAHTIDRYNRWVEDVKKHVP